MTTKRVTLWAEVITSKTGKKFISMYLLTKDGQKFILTTLAKENSQFVQYLIKNDLVQ